MTPPLSAAQWITDVLDSAGEAIAFVPIVVALLTIAAAVRGWYRRTIGRRRDRYRRFARLGTNGQLSFFTSVLGEPPAFKRKHLRKVRRYVLRDEFEAADDWTLAPAKDDGHEEEWEEADPDDLDDPDDSAGPAVPEYVNAMVPTTYVEYFFIECNYYVQAVCDEDGHRARVLRYDPSETLQPEVQRRRARATSSPETAQEAHRAAMGTVLRSPARPYAFL